MKPKEIIQAINSLTRTLEVYKKHNVSADSIKEITEKISDLIKLLS